MPAVLRLLPFRDVLYSIGLLEGVTFMMQYAPPLQIWCSELLTLVQEVLQLAKKDDETLMAQLPHAK